METLGCRKMPESFFVSPYFFVVPTSSLCGASTFFVWCSYLFITGYKNVTRDKKGL